MRRAFAAVLAAVGVLLGVAVVAAPSAAADTTITIRHDTYPVPCTGYVAIIASITQRSSDGAFLLARMHFGNNSSCTAYVQNIDEFWGGSCNPGVYKITGDPEHILSANAGPGAAWDWNYPFGSSSGSWVNRAGHPYWQQWWYTAYGGWSNTFKPASGC